MSKIKVKEISIELWPDLEKLFGSNGACGGCWCMSWRTAKGEKWEQIKGSEAKKRQRNLVKTGESLGLLAYSGQDPIGWCSFGPRKDYYKLDRAPSLKCDDAEDVWSIPCFFIHRNFRGRGVGTLLLRHAVNAITKRKGQIIEGYPVTPYNYGKEIPAAFAWTGTLSLFESAGFSKVGKPGGKQRVRLEL